MSQYTYLIKAAVCSKKVPDNTSRLWFSVVEDGYENESKPVTMGMIEEIKQESTVAIEGTFQLLDDGAEKRIIDA